VRLPASTRIVTGVALAGAAITAAWELTRWDHVMDAPHLDLVMETGAGIAALLVAFLLYGRFRLHRRLVDLALVCSLAMLGAAHLGYQVLPPALADDGHTAFAAWAAMAGHLSAGVIFAAAAFAGDRVVRMRSARWWGAASVALLVGAGVGAALFAPDGPPRAAEGDFGQVINAFGATVFFGVAYLFAARAHRTGDGLLMWVAVATALAALARVNYVIHPTLYTGGVGLGDFFRMLDHLALVAGGMLEIRRLWRGLATAAVAEERRRIARDWHDGVAQELAFIVRRERDSAPEVTDAARRGLDHARRAIAALREPEEGEDLATALEQAVARARRGSAAHVHVDVATGVRMEPDQVGEIARIVGEAVSNALRHGGATQVWVTLAGRRVVVRDDGRGFDPAAEPRPGAFGLAGMRERAARIGGELLLRSGASGTEVEVVLP
jgi:signal transduction histidine kinase